MNMLRVSERIIQTYWIVLLIGWAIYIQTYASA
jgi:hypothetical protein